MKERGLWRHWSTFLLILIGIINSPLVKCQSYEGARGDEGGVNSAALGFDGVVSRHDGYVKGETPTIPQTSFSCSAQPYNPGLYADMETQCQVYHVCFEDRQESFLCGPGTNFNQRILACDFWYNFECQDSPNFYAVNADIGKVPDTVVRQGQGRQPQQPQQPRQPQPARQPSFPTYPQQPAQPPSGGSFPTRVSVPSPPPRPVQPQFPVQPSPPRVQPPRVQPQQPRQPPSQPPRFQPEPPRIYPEPPAPRPQPRPDPDQTVIGLKPGYTRVSQGSAQGTKVRHPPPQQIPPTQQEEDNGYNIGSFVPPKPVSLPPPQPAHPQTPRPVFPPVVSPPRVSRPPLTPPVIRQPEISRPRIPAIDSRTEFHPDSNLKGNVDYRPPQQPRVPQPSRPVGTFPQYPVPQNPVPQQPAPQRPIPQRPITQRPIPQRPVTQRPVPQRPAAPPPVVHRPVSQPSRPAYQPPQTVQQEHVDAEYVPPPPPPPPREPSRPSTSYVPPPPPPPPRELSRPSTSYVPPPPPPPPREPSRPSTSYVPPPPSRPVIQKPVEKDFGKPQPPVSPSVIREQQKPASLQPSRPQVSVGSRQPQPPSRPRPVFPPASEHPNSNIKGGPGYNQPPPQIPRFEPTRIGRPSTPQGGVQVPPQHQRPRPVSPSISEIAVKPASRKPSTASGQAGYKPVEPARVKKPSEPSRSVYQPPIPVIDHPQVEIKGSGYEPSIPKEVQKVKSPSTSVSGIKLPQASVNQRRPEVQRPRAPVVVSRPQPPSFPITTVKKTSPVESQEYDKPKPQPPASSRVKQPSASQIHTTRPSQPRFPSYEEDDHPNLDVKGGAIYDQQPFQPTRISRPSAPPSAPSVSYEQKTATNTGCGSGSGYACRAIGGSSQQPSRTSRPGGIKTVSKEITAVKDNAIHPKPAVASQHSVLINKQSKPDYEAGSSYTRGPDIYPKPEFGQPNAPYQPVSTPSRSRPVAKQGSPSQNTITRSQNKPASRGPSASVGSSSDVRPDYPFDQVLGHQPPHERQVFPHRENPDHPNESIKGSGAYRPPPPAGFQAAASEVQEEKVEPEPEPSSLHGDTGME